MDTVYEIYVETGQCCREILPDVSEWFLSSGDTEDFIFYGEPDRIISEK